MSNRRKELQQVLAQQKKDQKEFNTTLWLGYKKVLERFQQIKNEWKLNDLRHQQFLERMGWSWNDKTETFDKEN